MNRRSSMLRPPATAARAIAGAVTVAALLAACSGRESAKTADTSHAAPDAGGAAVSTTTPAERVHIEVSGGPHAGVYDEQDSKTGCSYGLAGEKAWGNQYSIDTNDPKKFSSLQLIVPDTKAAAAGTSDFRITVGFGPLFGSGSTSYDVNTLPNASNKSGSGRVTVEDHGSTGRVTFDAKTAAGIGLKGTIECLSVLRNG